MSCTRHRRKRRGPDRIIAAAAAFTAVAPASAQARAGGDHPAIVVQRLHAAQGYDYLSKFYPHPAWLYLAAEAPRPMSDHPATIVARRERQARDAHAKVSAQSSLKPVTNR